MKWITILLAICTSGLWILFSPPITLAKEKPPTIEVYFSPQGGCTDAITRELDKAKSTVLIQAYSFTSGPIAKALSDAHKRGVKVEVILDKSQRTQQYSSATFLYNSAIPTKIDAQHTIAHNKVMIIDAETVITGSFNFTKAAEENNAENLLVIRDRKLASIYTKNWHEHAQHSEVYIGKAEPKQIRVAPRKESSPLESKLNEYYNTVWAKIKEQWAIPEKLRKEIAGVETVIVLKIDRGGRVKEMWYERRSGNPQYDQMAWQAIKKVEPFPPLPAEIKEDIFEFAIRFVPD